MLQEYHTLKTLQLFFDEPTKEHYLMEISKRTNLAHTSTKENLINLKNKNFIIETKEKKGKRIFPIYKTNLDNQEFKFYKKIFNLLNLEESGLITFIYDKTSPNSIILFGSYSRGEDIEESDIDLFVQTKEQTLNLEKFERLLHRKIHLHFKQKLSDYPNELKLNLLNGTVLRGYVEI